MTTQIKTKTGRTIFLNADLMATLESCGVLEVEVAVDQYLAATRGYEEALKEQSRGNQRIVQVAASRAEALQQAARDNKTALQMWEEIGQHYVPMLNSFAAEVCQAYKNLVHLKEETLLLILEATKPQVLEYLEGSDHPNAPEALLLVKSL